MQTEDRIHSPPPLIPSQHYTSRQNSASVVLHIGLLALSYPIDSKHHDTKNCEHSFFFAITSMVLSVVVHTNETVRIYL